MPAGRQALYTIEIADEICERLAQGESLNAICKAEGYPAESTVRLWAMEDREGFAAKYAQAREVGYERMAEEILEISDDSSQDTQFTEQGAKPDNEWINRSRLRVDTRKWLLSKCLPKVYGDRSQVAVTDADGNAAGFIFGIIGAPPKQIEDK